MTINGLEPLIQQVAEAEAALQDINGQLGEVTFEADDPASIEAAITTLHATIREWMSAYMNNPLVAPIVEALMEDCRQAVIERAQAVRLDGAA